MPGSVIHVRSPVPVTGRARAAVGPVEVRSADPPHAQHHEGDEEHKFDRRDHVASPFPEGHHRTRMPRRLRCHGNALSCRCPGVRSCRCPGARAAVSRRRGHGELPALSAVWQGESRGRNRCPWRGRFLLVSGSASRQPRQPPSVGRGGRSALTGHCYGRPSQMCDRAKRRISARLAESGAEARATPGGTAGWAWHGGCTCPPTPSRDRTDPDLSRQTSGKPGRGLFARTTTARGPHRRSGLRLRKRPPRRSSLHPGSTLRAHAAVFHALVA